MGVCWPEQISATRLEQAARHLDIVMRKVIQQDLPRRTMYKVTNKLKKSSLVKS